MIKTGLIGVNDYSLPAPTGKMAEKISFDKKEIIVKLGKILTDLKTVRKKGDRHVFRI
jgi:hypothetical protein